jgi:hypothetical protein
MSLAKKLLSVQPAAGGGAFNPETDITWHSLFWAEGTDFVAEGYSDTDEVLTWPNETGEQAAVGVTTKVPLYVAADTDLNGQPSVQWDVGSQGNLNTALFDTAPNYASGGVSLVAVMVTDASVSDVYAFTGPTNPSLLRVQGDDRFRINAGFSKYSIAGAVPAPGVGYLIHVNFSGDTGYDTLFLNDANIRAAPDDAGSNQLVDFRMGNAVANMQLAFMGIYEGGDIAADASWPDFKTWVSDHYGITIA